MQKEVLLNAEEVFRLIGRQSWEIECLKAKVEKLSQALRTAPKEPPTETAEKPEKEKSAIERNRDAREKAVMEAIEKALAERGETLEAGGRQEGITLHFFASYPDWPEGGESCLGAPSTETAQIGNAFVSSKSIRASRFTNENLRMRR